MDIDSFILIGGRSRRLGRDKAFVEVDGETLAERAARTIESGLSPSHITFVAAAEDQFDPKVLFELARPMVADLKPGFGSWSGVHAALSYSRMEWTFVLACDLPFVTPDFLALLAHQTETDVEAVIPRQPDGRLQPLCAFYRTRPALEKIGPMLDLQQSLPPLNSVSGILRSRMVEPAEFGLLADSDKFFHNVNTPDDVRVTS